MSWTIRAATVDDVPELVTLRRVMFEAMGQWNPEALDRTCEESGRYFERHVPTGAFRAWVAEIEGGKTPIASIGLVIHSVPPGPRNLEGRVGYIMSLVTIPAHRRQGIATALLEHVLDVLRSEGIPMASLHAAHVGRGIYERAGFAIDESLPEMRLRLT